MRGIKIVKALATPFPAEMGEAWIDAIIPLATPDQIAHNVAAGNFLGHPGKARDHYIVHREQAMAALRKTGRGKAVAFWDSILTSGDELMWIEKSACEEIEVDPSGNPVPPRVAAALQGIHNRERGERTSAHSRRCGGSLSFKVH